MTLQEIYDLIGNQHTLQRKILESGVIASIQDGESMRDIDPFFIGIMNRNFNPMLFMYNLDRIFIEKTGMERGLEW
jgi:hypothetical protein